uniref:Putative glycosyltransferase n=1 Tax=viral metagenome TaxID=1070528 RepID=A0A6M3LZZ6_9ZZZZ
MRIMFIGAHYHALREALRKLGHEAVGLDYWRWFASGESGPDEQEFVRLWPDQAGSPLSSADVQERVIKGARLLKPDAVVQFKGWVDGQRKIEPATIRALKEEHGCRTVYWSVDDPDFVGWFLHQLCPPGTWDVALTCCRDSLAYYRRADVPQVHLFYPGHDVGWPVEDLEAWASPPPGCPRVIPESVDLVIAGHPYWRGVGSDVARADVAVRALDMGLTVALYGPPDTWDHDFRAAEKAARGAEAEPLVNGYPRLCPHYHGWLPHDEVWRAYLNAKVVFNNHLRKDPGNRQKYQGYLNDKVFQICGTGGAVMVMDEQPGVSPEVYTAGEEYLEYRRCARWEDTLDEAMSVIKRAVDDQEIRRSVSKAARQRTLEQHMWDNRAAQLVDILGAAGVR